jgi:hypothetical protein
MPSSHRLVEISTGRIPLLCARPKTGADAPRVSAPQIVVGGRSGLVNDLATNGRLTNRYERRRLPRANPQTSPGSRIDPHFGLPLDQPTCRSSKTPRTSMKSMRYGENWFPSEHL